MGQNTSKTNQPQTNLTRAQQQRAAQPIPIKRNTALLHASKNGDLSRVRDLVSQGVDLSFEDTDPKGYCATALHSPYTGQHETITQQ